MRVHTLVCLMKFSVHKIVLFVVVVFPLRSEAVKSE